MAYISQSIEYFVEQPSVTWRQDISLDPPRLLFPLDECHICPQIYLLFGQSAGVTLSWTSVAGASFYVVQIADNTSFTGPNVRAEKTTALTFDLNYIEHLRVRDQLFWRVAAYNLIGGFSVMSDVFSIKVACPEMAGTSIDNENSSYADVDSPQMCDHAGVDIALEGPKWVVKKCTERVWVLNVNYDCTTYDGLTVSIDNVVWEIKQSSSNPVTISSSDTDHIILDIDSDVAEWFEIVANVVFTLGSVGTFICKQHKKVLIEGKATPSGGGGLIRFSIDHIFCDDHSAIAVVQSVPCDNSFPVEVGDTIRIWDRAGCWFDVQDLYLQDAQGFAAYMVSDEADPYGDPYETGCEWQVVSLCLKILACGPMEEG